MTKTVVFILGTVVAGMVLAATTWNFAMTSNAVNKTEHTTVHENIDKKLEKIYDKLMEIYKEMPKDDTLRTRNQIQRDQRDTREGTQRSDISDTSKGGPEN